MLDRVGREARWYRYRLPILIGVLGALALFALYLTIVTLAQGWQHAIELFGQDAWLVIPIMTRFWRAGGTVYLFAGDVAARLAQFEDDDGRGGRNFDCGDGGVLRAPCGRSAAAAGPLGGSFFSGGV